MKNKNRGQSERFLCKVRTFPKLFIVLGTDSKMQGKKKVNKIFLTWFVNFENVCTYVLAV